MVLLPQAEILCLGNELLIGRTINTNATYISLELTKIGFDVQFHITIKDDLWPAVAVLQEIMERSPDVLVICGGLGPTHDDIQLECISKALKRDLIVNEDALQMLEKRYRSRGLKMTPFRRKMATLPEGSIPLNNSVGSAPGVLTKVKRVKWFSVPGVPKEMKAILHEEILPLLKKDMPHIPLFEVGFNAYNIGESGITEFTAEVMEKYPSLNYKSHPKKDEKGYWLAFHVYGFGDIKEKVLQAAEFWKERIDSIETARTTEIQAIFNENFESE